MRWKFPFSFNWRVYLFLRLFLWLTVIGFSLFIEYLPAAEYQVVDLRVNDPPYSGKTWIKGGGPTERILSSRSSLYSLYRILVFPGESYTLTLQYPLRGQRVKVSVVNAWPSYPLSRRYDLPLSQNVLFLGQTTRIVKWLIPISPESSSALLYILVESSAGTAGTAELEHTISITFPPEPVIGLRYAGQTLDRAIYSVRAPQSYLLVSESAWEPWIKRPKPEEVKISVRPLKVAIPGDQIKNGDFTSGLNYWQPHEWYVASDFGPNLSLQPDGFRIRSTEGNTREGILQNLGIDVSKATSLILTAQVRVDFQTLGGTGPSARDAPIAIAVGYVDEEGIDHYDLTEDPDEKTRMFWRGFYYLDPPEPSQVKNGTKVARGTWQQFQVDLMQLNPKPKLIKFLSIEGSGWASREGWVRNVHLILRNSTK